MTWDNEKNKGYRVYSRVFNLDLDINAAGDYYNDPASYETPKTTADSLSYQEGLTRRYSYSDAKISGQCFPNLEVVSITPAVLKVGEDVSLSASATVSLTDFISNDTYELQGNYSDRRVEASHFKKLFARNYIENRECNIQMGYLPNQYNDSNYLTQNYVIKSFSYPSAKGDVSFSLIDRLFYVSDTKNKAPQTASTVLTNDIDETQTNVDFTGVFLGNNGFDPILFGEFGFIVIGNEIMSYVVTALSVGGGSMVVVRGLEQGDAAKSHSAGATIQGVLAYEDTNVTDVVLDLFFRFSKIDNYSGASIGDFIDSAGITDLGNNELVAFRLTNFITKPVEVKTLLKELMQCSGAFLYFDVIDNKVKMGASTRFEDAEIIYDENIHILQNTLKISTEYSKQVTRAKIWSNKVNYTQGNDARYYANSFEYRDDLVESAAYYKQTFAAKDIFCNWYTKAAQDQKNAADVISLKVNRFAQPPEKFVFKVGSEWVGNIAAGQFVWYGSPIGITTKQRLNPDGSDRTYAAQIIAIKPLVGRDEFEITAVNYNAGLSTDVDLVIDSNKTDYELATELNPTEARQYVVLIESNVRILASAPYIPAFYTGMFPAGSSLKIINQGFIYGLGGVGGSGSSVPANGFAGGVAMLSEVDLIIDNLVGEIGGGGGGGGGSVSLVNSNGCGGGAGAGAGVVSGGVSDVNGFDGGNSGFGFAGTGGNVQPPDFVAKLTPAEIDVLGEIIYGYLGNTSAALEPNSFVFNSEIIRVLQIVTNQPTYFGLIDQSSVGVTLEGTPLYLEVDGLKQVFGKTSDGRAFSTNIYENGTDFDNKIKNNLGVELDFSAWYSSINGLHGGNGGGLGEAGQDAMGTDATGFGLGGAGGSAIEAGTNSVFIETGSGRIYGDINAGSVINSGSAF